MAQESTHKTGEGGGWISEDWLALILGLIIFGLSLGSFKGTDLLLSNPHFPKEIPFPEIVPPGMFCKIKNNPVE